MEVCFVGRDSNGYGLERFYMKAERYGFGIFNLINI